MTEDDGIPGHPTCPVDGVLLREEGTDYVCPACGYREVVDVEVLRPQSEDGNVIDFPGPYRDN